MRKVQKTALWPTVQSEVGNMLLVEYCCESYDDQNNSTDARTMVGTDFKDPALEDLASVIIISFVMTVLLLQSQ